MDESTERRAQRYGRAAGLAFVGLFAVGNALWAFDAPGKGAAGAEIVAFYDAKSSEIAIGATLSLLSIAAFMLFASVVRRVLADAEGDDVLATTAFGGALLALAAGLGAESINMVGALRAGEGQLDEALARSLFEVSQILGTAAAATGVGIFASVTAAVALRTGLVLPRWLALATLLVGISLFTPLGHTLEWPGAAMMLVALAVSLSLRGERPRSGSAPMPEEGLEPPTRGL